MKTKSNELKTLAEVYSRVYEQTEGADLDNFDERIPRRQSTDKVIGKVPSSELVS